MANSLSQSGDPIRIMYVIASMDVGGTQTQLLELLQALDRRRFDPHLLCLTGKGELLSEARELGIAVHENHIPVSWARAGLLRNVFRTAILFQRQSIQVAHCYLPRGNLVGMLAAKMAGVPIGLTSKRGLHRPRSRSEALAIRVADLLAARVVANAKAVGDYAIRQEGCRVEKVQVVSNGVDNERFRPLGNEVGATARKETGLAPDAPVIGTVTRLRSRKGLDTLVATLAQLVRERPQIQALVVGDVPTGAIHPMLAEAGITERVVLAGVRRDLPRMFAAMDIFVLASTDGEGMPNVVLEAMACGKPVVVTDVGGSREVVPAEAGVVVKPGDAPAIASSVLNILGDKLLAERMGRNARKQVARRFSVAAMARATEQIYLELLNISSN